MRKEILLPAAVRQELSKTFGVERHSLNNYLTYRSNSPRARMLRAAALERGGLIYTGIKAPAEFIPDVETTFDHANGVMHQTFRDRIKLSVNLKDNVTTVYVDGSEAVRFDNMTTASWGNVLYSLQQAYNQLNS